MIYSDFFSLVQWFLTIFLVGVPFLTLSNSLFPTFFDRGYIFTKILGIAIVSYIIFLSGIFHILPFSQATSFFILIAVGIVLNCFIIRKNRTEVVQLIKDYTPVFLFEELLFFSGLLFWSWIKTFSPDIHGLEKFMDYGFINSILRSDYFPPKDMWFTPFTINYYYFGHIITAILTKLSGIPSSITFNLMISTVFSLCFVASFSLGGNLYTHLVHDKFSKIKVFTSGILSALLVTLSGNLHIIYTLYAAYDVAHPKPFWEMAFSPQTFPNAYWYPNATRFIYNTIHEFPMYSWVVSDLHGHVLDIPFVLLTIALLLSVFFRQEKTTLLTKENSTLLSKGMALISGKEVLIGFLLAVMYMTNAWDGLIYLLLAIIIYGVSALQQRYVSINGNYKQLLTVAVFQQMITTTILLFVSFIIFVFPFSFFFKPFVSGLGILSAPDFLVAKGKIGPFLFEANHTQHSPWWQLLILYGFFLFYVISYTFFLLKSTRRKKIDLFILTLILLSMILIFVPEVLYVKDIYPEHYRANTMFKLVFQAYIILSLVTGFVISRILLAIKKTVLHKIGATFFFIITTTLLFAVFSYPYFAISAYYNNLQTQSTLDGTTYLKKMYPDDYLVIQWLQKNVKGQPVILEAQGDSYTDYARISSNTGLPTVLGWTVHEWLWRGTYDIPAPRIEEVKTLYETTNIDTAKALIKKYQITYVYVGELEQEKYQVSSEKFKTLGKSIYMNNASTLYKLSD